MAPALRAYGVDCIHIKSSRQLPLHYKHNEIDFVENLEYNGNLDKLLNYLDRLTIKLCIPGYESGVELADLLSEKLGLANNNSLYSKGRRDKNIMNKMVAKAGLRTIEQLKSADLEAFLKWADQPNTLPLVLKPLESANGDGVYFCHNKQDIKNAFQKIMLALNQFGEKNIEVLAEKLNVGQEYIINCVSFAKNHYVAEIWRVKRQPFSTIYDTVEMVSPFEEEWDPLRLYTQNVLDALFIYYGASTTEVKFTKEGGPLLIETSARLMAGAPLSFSHQILGFTQLSLLLEAFLQSDCFLKRLEKERSFLKQKGLGVILISDCEGTLKNNIRVKFFDDLSTLHSYHIQGKSGKYLYKTINSLTAPGEVFLMGENLDLLREDYHRIRLAEEQGLYRNALSGI